MSKFVKWIESIPRTFIIVMVSIGLEACSPGQGNNMENSQPKQMNLKEIYLAGGCFWGTEHFFSLVPGVISTEPGYANSVVASPTYQQVCTGQTEAAETVHITYDADKIGLPYLLELFYQTIDPLSLNRQGPDIGTQYRTGIYVVDTLDIPIVEKSLKSLRDTLGLTPVIEYGRIGNFYSAEEYHRDYLKKNPGGYCHIDHRMFDVARNAKDPSKATQ